MNTINRRQFLAGAGATGAGLAATAIPTAAQAGSGDGQATRIIRNARVYVGDRANTIAEAIAVGADGTILGVGSYRSLKRYVGYSTEVINGHGGTVISGIQDGHAHPMYAGLASLNPTMEDAVLSAADVQSLVATFLADPQYGSEPDSWLTVEAWNPAGTPDDTLPNKDILDSLATSRPIVLNGSDGHNIWVNSKALQIAGVDASTPDPAGGKIVRDTNGEPTGVLKDSATQLVTQYIPETSPDQMYDSFAWAFAQMAAGGITSIFDAWVEPWQLGFYAALAENGQLLQRTHPALLVSTRKVARPEDVLAKVKRLAKRYKDVPNLHFGQVKVFMDGVIEYPAQTAALLRPYTDADGNPTDNYGELYVDAATFGAFSTVMDKAGWQVHAHAIGDRAVRTALDGYEMARKANGRTGNRHTIAHLQLVHPNDYPRFAKLGRDPRHAAAVGVTERLDDGGAAALHRRQTARPDVPGQQPPRGGSSAGRWLGLAGRPALPVEPGGDGHRPNGSVRGGCSAQPLGGHHPATVVAHAHPRHRLPAAPGEDRPARSRSASRPTSYCSTSTSAPARFLRSRTPCRS